MCIRDSNKISPEKNRNSRSEAGSAWNSDCIRRGKRIGTKTLKCTCLLYTSLCWYVTSLFTRVSNVTRITGNTALAQTNPLRYRSYYYDSEKMCIRDRYLIALSEKPEYNAARWLRSEMCIRDRKITETASPEDAISVLSRYFENPMVKLDKDGCMGMELSIIHI